MASMECGCVCDAGYNGEGPECFSETTPRAVIPHVCCECGETIEPGQQYERVTGKWDGYFSTYDTCMPCRQMRHDFCGCGWVYGGLGQALWEALGVDPFTGEMDED